VSSRAIPPGCLCDQPKVTTSVEGLGDALYGALNSPAGACGSAKMEQAGKAAYCLLKCYAKAQAKGIPFDPNCVDVGPKSCIRKFTDSVWRTEIAALGPAASWRT